MSINTLKRRQKIKRREAKSFKTNKINGKQNTTKENKKSREM